MNVNNAFVCTMDINFILIYSTYMPIYDMCMCGFCNVWGCVCVCVERLYWIYVIPTHDTHQWLLLQFLVLLMMDTESVRNM